MPLRIGFRKSGFQETRDDLVKIRERADREVIEATRDMVNRQYQEMRENINRTSGSGTRGFHTYETIEQEVERLGFAEAEGVAGTSDEIALILQYGSRPHRIPREGSPTRALSFVWRGARRIFHHVNHPGTRAYRWMEQASSEAEAYKRQRWHKAARHILYGEEY